VRWREALGPCGQKVEGLTAPPSFSAHQEDLPTDAHEGRNLASTRHGLRPNAAHGEVQEAGGPKVLTLSRTEWPLSCSVRFGPPKMCFRK
jgi:hypothetical protein